ncbi:hypothetical protein [Paenibacillus nasutitermitis]|uniref:SnoaL-like domain-containing protein n=1 Tax=Paenibacillus nasutitermitis TaxID=1652958 RepID=A0A917E0Q5_9BACL|nr:hypothetical protein [Paenibacillus nasutitermitis]GGD85555.1 hypothetical protein GCM10010911_49930 [Paenibacillus nasutitermitis]
MDILNEISTFVQRYSEVWNETDVGHRRRVIAELWSEDASHYTETLEAHGHDAIETRITEAYGEFVGTGKYVFKALDNAASHHNVMRLQWVMLPQDGGKAAALGTVFIVLGGDGRILSDYQFSDEL